MLAVLGVVAAALVRGEVLEPVAADDLDELDGAIHRVFPPEIWLRKFCARF